MTLILTRPPPQPLQGMIGDDNHIIRPGGAPPFVSPHCRVCRIPVERFTLDPISSWFYLGIQAHCHGKTTGIRIPVEQAVHNRATGELTWMF